MGVLNTARKIIVSFKQAIKYYKYGGVSTAIISTPDYDEILKDKCILITGGSSGIGFSIAKKCVETGARVIITGRNESKLKEACNQIGKYCNYLVWDISNINEIQSNLDKCAQVFTQEPDILINNAGIAPTKFWGEVDENEWEKIYSINLKGQYFITQEITNRWKRTPSRNYRKIINISSQGGFVGATYPYRMVKWDVRGLTEGLGKLLIKDRIIVNGIAPGVVKTSMQAFSLQQGDNLYCNQNPLGRVILPEEIAELALFLISDASNAIVGQTIVCDGGYILK